ncbi:MAG TPA: hypothetical protein EYH06_08950 [Chromatiales bacterium]|nr:hypothetical protein [Thiotrichales bacterium]HIP68703.1 hypothetical protein [Chromatiales bacterium]
MEFEAQLQTCKIGQPHKVITLERRDENRLAAIQLAGQARHEILIISREFEPMIYGHHEFTDHIGQFIRDRRTDMRILVRDERPMIRHSHRLAEMAISYSSKIAIRKLGSTDKDYNEAWMLCDSIALLYRPIADLFEATLDCYTPRRGKECQEAFEKMWGNAELIPELRALKI